MKEIGVLNINYNVCSSMCVELGLDSHELLIYAIIYSFTRGERGLYYGTNEYLARSSGMSLSSAKRTITNLLKRGYIEKYTFNDRRGYRATDNAILRTCVGDKGVLAKSSDMFCGEGDKQSEVAARRITSRTPRERNDVKDYFLDSADRPKYEFHTVGRNELVSMTEEQYKSLLKLVDSEVLFAYLRRLELLIRDKGYRTFSPYKTIKKWIREDTEV